MDRNKRDAFKIYISGGDMKLGKMLYTFILHLCAAISKYIVYMCISQIFLCVFLASQGALEVMLFTLLTHG